MRKIFFAIMLVACMGISAEAAQAPDADTSLRYSNIALDKVTCEVGVVISDAADILKVEVAAYATGQGTDFRKWEIVETKLVVQGELVRQQGESKKFYTTKESLLRYPAAVAFAALGSQYQRFYPEYSVSGGTATPTGAFNAVGGVAGVIDAVGMSAGLGLLVTQAKGEITGTKSNFYLNKKAFSEEVDPNEIEIKFVVENRESDIKYRVKTKLGSFREEKVEDEDDQ